MGNLHWGGEKQISRRQEGRQFPTSCITLTAESTGTLYPCPLGVPHPDAHPRLLSVMELQVRGWYEAVWFHDTVIMGLIHSFLQ